MNFQDLLRDLFKWMREILPWTFSTALVVFNHMTKKIRGAELKQEQAVLEEKYAKHKLETDLKFSGMSDADVVLAASDGKLSPPAKKPE